MCKIFLTLSLATTLLRAEPATERFTVTVRGHGPDVLLIPGLACSSAVWNPTADHFDSHYRMHLVQVAGFGGAPARGNATGPVLQPLVNALDAYIKTNKLKAPLVIGHSLGGLAGMMLASQHPEDVGKVLVVDSLPFFSVLTGAANASEAEPRAAGLRDMMLNESQDDYAKGERQFLHVLVKSPDGFNYASTWAVASDKSVVARAIYEDMITDLRPKLSQIKTPVTVLYPWDPSSGMTVEMVDGIYKDNFAALPNKKLIRIDNSYHFIMFDQPQALERQIEVFLK